jgi:hypothetical protein
MKGLYLNKATYLLFNNEPIIFKNEQMTKLAKFLEKKLKKNKFNFLFSFEVEILNEKHIERNVENIKISEYSITHKHQVILFVSNLKSMLKNKDFNFVKEKLMVDFY